jgi:mono/diheme cytochrome c family protein
VLRLLGLAVVVVVVIGAAGWGYVRTTGLSAQATPGRLESALAATARRWAVPPEYRGRQMDLPRNQENLRAGLEHFADHCASCHDNDGSGQTALGKGLFPPSPDMRAAGTQGLTDGELLYVIEHGIRFTGMPAWGNGTADGERLGWQLVQFIRHLPELTAAEVEEMKALNPRPPADIRRELEEQRFLAGQ